MFTWNNLKNKWILLLRKRESKTLMSFGFSIFEKFIFKKSIQKAFYVYFKNAKLAKNVKNSSNWAIVKMDVQNNIRNVYNKWNTICAANTSIHSMVG